MILEELKQFKQKLLSERQKAIDAINAKYTPKLDAINVLLDDETDIAAGDLPPVQFGNEIGKKLNKLAATREAIGHNPSSFTTAKLFVYVKAKYPKLVEIPSDLSNSVWMLKKDEEIEVVKKGAGPDNPPEYRTTAKFRSADGSGA